MLQRFLLLLRELWRRFVARFRREPEEPEEDPEVLLSRVQHAMAEMQARSRERAAHAITQKNNLKQMVEDTQKRVDRLQSKADDAASQGDHELERQLLREKEQYEVTLTGLRNSLAKAEETVEAVKDAIRREETRVRRKTVEILTLKVRWRIVQIQADLLAAFNGPEGEDNPEQRRERVTQILLQKNILQQLAEDLGRRASSLEAKAEAAFGRGDWRLALGLLREREGYEESLAAAAAALGDAVAVVEALAATLNPDNDGD